MTHRPLLPPRGVFIGTLILFVPDISPPARETLLQLMALAWGSDTNQTPLLTMTLLENLTGKKARTLRGHLAFLRSYRDVLRLQPAGNGQFIILFSPWVFGKQTGAAFPAGVAGKSLPVPVNDEDDINLLPLHPGLDSPDSDDRRAAVRPAAAVFAPAPGQNAAAPSLSPRLAGLLTDAGIFTALIPEIAKIARDQGWSETDLEALLGWCREEFPDRPGGMYVARLRRGFRPPERYYTPACPRCGMYGGHAQDCPRRYGTWGNED